MSLMPDVRYAVRLLARTPLFTATAVISLAVGIAGSAAIFSLADALLLRPRVGVASPATLVDIGRSTDGQGMDNFGFPLFEAMRSGTTLLADMSAHRMGPDVMSLGDARASERVFAALVSGNYFGVVGTQPALGRFFLPEEDRTEGTHPVVVLSHAFWTRRFAADPAIVGRTLRLNNRPYTVVGIAEAGFAGTTAMGADLWVPMAMDAHVRAADRSLRGDHDPVWMVALGRLKPGATAPQARDELHGIMQAYLRDRGDNRADHWGVSLTPSQRIPGSNATPVVGFFGVLGALTLLVLIIACSNVAGMLVARGLGRDREFAARLAVGASRRRLVRQLLIEGLALAVIAGAVSVPVTAALVGLLAAYLPSFPVPLALELRVDPRVQAVSFALAAFAAIAFSLVPALQTTRVDVMSVLRGASSSADRRRAWFRQLLVGGQVAIALVLLVAAGLFARSLQNAASVDVGFTVADVDTLLIDTRIAGYMSDSEGNRVVDQLLTRFRALPGVTGAAAGRLVPLQGSRIGFGTLRLAGYTAADGTDRVTADWDSVSADYFRTLELPIVEGRPFDGRDGEGAPLAVIVNQTLARRLWPGESALGRVLQFEAGDSARPLHVVGVVRDAKTRMIWDPPAGFVYVPLTQQFRSEVTFFVRRSDGTSRAADLRREVAAFDPMLPVIHSETLESATTLTLLPQRLAAWVAGSVACVGLFLVALGIYGLTAFSVSQRRREMAIRIAVGAPPGSVVWLVLRQALVFTGAGAAVGLALAAGLASVLRAFLIGLEPIDTMAFGVAVALVASVVIGSSWPSARRAATMDPLTSLRMD